MKLKSTFVFIASTFLAVCLFSCKNDKDMVFDDVPFVRVGTYTKRLDTQSRMSFKRQLHALKLVQDVNFSRLQDLLGRAIGYEGDHGTVFRNPPSHLFFIWKGE